MNTKKDCHGLYLKVNVLILACVFETFRKKFIHFFELNSPHYLPISGYSWDAMIRFTDVNLKLISDNE